MKIAAVDLRIPLVDPIIQAMEKAFCRKFTLSFFFLWKILSPFKLFILSTGSSIYFGPACNGNFLNIYRQFSQFFFSQNKG